MAFNFPPSPSNGDTYTANGFTYEWDGSKWIRKSPSAGAQGNVGAQGAQGYQGATAAAGAQGAQGHQGHQGAAGAQGNQGHQGAGGSNGTNGAQGAQGHQGHQGAAGAQGAQGHQGHQGAGGSAGAQGNQGHQGAANATTINSNTDHYLITGTGTANTLQGESSAQWNGTSLTLEKSTNAYLNPDLNLYNSYNGGWGGGISFSGKYSGSKATQARVRVYGGQNANDASLVLETGTPTEGFRLDSSQRVIIASGSYNATNVSNYKMFIKETANENAAIRFLDTDNMKGGICGIARGTNQLITGTTNVDFVVGSVYSDTHLIYGVSGNQDGAIGMTINAPDGGFTAFGNDFNFRRSDSGVLNIRLQNSSTGYNDNDGFLIQLDANEDGYVWHREAKAIYFGTSDTTSFHINSSGHLIPMGSKNLGSSSSRWANLYINDLQLSNKGSSNVVDGTWGDWTLQEGESDVYMINNRSGKKFKIKMEEVE